jgi:outer membrane protein TolC
MGLLALGGIAAAQSNGGLPPDLATLVAEALQANPDIKQMRSLTTASQEASRSAGALDNPELGFRLRDLPDNFRTDVDPMTQKMVEVGQRVPFPGKRRLRTEVAEEQAKADDFLAKDKLNEVRTRVIASYWGLSQAFSGFDITAANKVFWEQVVKAAEARYQVGRGNQADVLQAQVELGNYLDRLLQWTQKQESLKADLNALRAQPPGANVPRPQLLKPRLFALNLDDLMAQAQVRPQLQALKAIISKQEKAVDLARKEYFPDATLYASWGFREALAPPANRKQNDLFSAGVMFSLPVWLDSKIKPKIREEAARQSAAREAHQASLNQLAALIKDRHARLQRLSHQITLYGQGILPQSRQAVGASLMAYQVGSMEFTQLYQSQITAYNNELQLQEYLKDFEENWAELEWLVGAELHRRPGGKP